MNDDKNEALSELHHLPDATNSRKDILRQLQDEGLGARESRAVPKLRVDLVPAEWVTFLAEVLGAGAEKYDDHNWKRGLPMTETAASLERHLLAWKAGEDIDADSGCSHMAHAAWNALAIEFFRRAGRLELDDRENKPVLEMRLNSIIGYVIEVLLPGPDNDSMWCPHRGKAATADAALHVMDSLARGEYTNRTIRVREVREFEDEPGTEFLSNTIRTYFPGDLSETV